MAPPPPQLLKYTSVSRPSLLPEHRVFGSLTPSDNAGRSCLLSGHWLYSGAELTMRLVPAAADTGIVFIRTDIADRDEASIPALFGSVCDVTLSTKIGNSHGHVVGTIEHLLAALAGMGLIMSSLKSTGRKCRLWMAAPNLLSI